MMQYEAPAPCPHCQKGNLLHSGMTGDGAPRPGDIALCWGCRLPGVFATTTTGALTIRLPTQAEWMMLRKDPDISRALSAADGASSVHEATERYQQSGEA